VVLVQRKLLDRLPPSDARYVCLDDESVYSNCPDDEPENGATASSLAYVMYTSGSTGQPKGVCIPHRAIARLVLNTDYLQLGPEDRVAQAANTAFDAATFEIWGPLLTGGCIVIMPRDISLNAREMAAFLRSEWITAMFLTTALFNQAAQQAPDAFRSLRSVLFGGEQVDPRWVREVLKAGPPERLLHVYGPTETTTFATWHWVKDVPEEAGTVPIGRPIANTTLYVLDRVLQPVPAGVPGELYIGGDGLARGYLHSPELTAARFVPSPFAEAGGARLYKTGDRVRYLSDGSVEFLGRLDSQVKLRGFRIELGEIESVLDRHDDVGESVAMVREDAPGNKRLVAYVVARAGKTVDASAVRAFLKEQLPDYMVPSAIVMLGSFPLTANGKVDRRALPAPKRDDLPDVAGMVEPRTSIQRALADIWRAVLKVDRLSIHDNFFDLGGHSLLATQVVAQIRDSLGVTVPLRTLFETQTIATLAERVGALLAAEGSAGQPGEAVSRAGDPCVVALQSEGGKTPFFCATGAGSVAGYYGPMASCFAGGRPFYGLQDPRLDEDESFPSVGDLAGRFIRAIRTVQPKGPYLVGGWSFGGIVAFEMALQLHRQGEKVAFLGLIDTGAPVSRATVSQGVGQTLRGLAKKTLRRGRFLFVMRGTILGYLRDAARLALAAMLGKRDPAVSHLTTKDYFQWVKHDLSTQHNLTLAGLAERGAQHSRLTLIHEPFVWHVFRTTQARGHAMAAYKVTPYPGRISLFRAESGVTQFYEDDTTLGWKDVPKEGIDVHVIPGNHTVLLRKPYVETLAHELQKGIDAADPNSQPFNDG
jgi:amino acid adenylation domain-containing protein